MIHQEAGRSVESRRVIGKGNTCRMMCKLAVANSPTQKPVDDSGVNTMMEAGTGADRRRSTQEILRDRTVLDHLPLVVAIAVRVHENLPVAVDLDDLIQAGIRGLSSAASKNPRGKRVDFESSARYRIKVAILDSLRIEFPAKEEFPDSICPKEGLREMLKSAMETAPERHQKVVIMYYTYDLTMREIGGLLGISERRVSQIHKTALEKMTIALQSSSPL